MRLGVPYQSVWLSYVIALLLFLMLTSGDLVRTVRAMDIGPVRAVTLPVAQGIDRVSNLLSINRPADALGAALGREVHDPPEQQVDFKASKTTPGGRHAAAARGDGQRSPGGARGGRLDGPAVGPVDGVGCGEGPHLGRDLRVQDLLWPGEAGLLQLAARLADVASEVKPEALVMMIGGNDAQELTDPGGNVVARPGTPGWSVEYRHRVDQVFDGLRADNRRLFWVLQPNVASAKHQASVVAMNTQVRESAADRPWVTLIDGPALTAGPDGGYADFVTLPDGKQISCRHGDGVHLTVGCTQLVSDATVDEIAKTWAIGETAAPAGTPLDPTDGKDASDLRAAAATNGSGRIH